MNHHLLLVRSTLWLGNQISYPLHTEPTMEHVFASSDAAEQVARTPLALAIALSLLALSQIARGAEEGADLDAAWLPKRKAKAAISQEEWRDLARLPEWFAAPEIAPGVGGWGADRYRSMFKKNPPRSLAEMTDEALEPGTLRAENYGMGMYPQQDGSVIGFSWLFSIDGHNGPMSAGGDGTSDGFWHYGPINVMLVYSRDINGPWLRQMALLPTKCGCITAEPIICTTAILPAEKETTDSGLPSGA